MTLTLAQAIKQQILANLQTLQSNGVISSFVAVDRGKDPLSKDNAPPNGYPFAIVGMPRVASDMEDTASNMRTYHFDILFVLSYETMTDDYTVEGTIDQVLNQFDTDFTLHGTAIAAQVPPAQIQAFPVTTPSGDYACFVVTIEARTLYQLGT